MRVLWLPETKADLDRIDEFWRGIDEKLPAKAAKVILGLAESVEQFPDRGRPSGIDPLTRELIGKFGAGAFILRYRIVGETIFVVQVRHSKEKT